MEELIPIVLFGCIATVLILRPITRPLGSYLQSLADRNRGPAPASVPAAHEPALERIADLLDNISTRMDLLEDRVEFVERLSDRKVERKLTG